MAKNNILLLGVLAFYSAILLCYCDRLAYWLISMKVLGTSSSMLIKYLYIKWLVRMLTNLLLLNNIKGGQLFWLSGPHYGQLKCPRASECPCNLILRFCNTRGKGQQNVTWNSETTYDNETALNIGPINLYLQWVLGI